MTFTAAASALSLAMDAFAVSIGVGASLAPGEARKAVRYLALACGLFQFFMPLLGGLLGDVSEGGPFRRWVPLLDHWLAFGLLAFVGGNMVREALKGKEDSSSMNPAASFRLLLSLAVATSIDALVVGVSFTLVGWPVLELALDAGVVTALLCLLGGRLGRFAGVRLGARAELSGGILLLLIGANVLVSHLLDHGLASF